MDKTGRSILLYCGESVFLTGSAIRARYRESVEQGKLLKPGEINLYHFDQFYFISRAIEKGSRLRLVISSPNSIHAQKNYCSGGIIAYETEKDAHTAHVKYIMMLSTKVP